MEVLVERLKDDPTTTGWKPKYVATIYWREKAYFNSQWQIQTGAVLLLIGAIVLAFALRVFYSAKAKIEAPEKVLENEIASRILAQKGIIISGAVVFALAIGASFASVNYLDKYNIEATVAENEPQTADEGIQVIEVGSAKPIIFQTVTTGDSAVSAVVAADSAKIETAPAAVALTAQNIKTNHNSFRGPFRREYRFIKYPNPMGWRCRN